MAAKDVVAADASLLELSNRQSELTSVPSQTSRRELALLEAAQYGQVKRAKRYIDAGDVDLDFVNFEGRTALQFAAENGRLEIVQMLIQADCDVDSSSKICGTALCLAAIKSHVEIVHVLLEAGADINAPGGGLGSALHAACHAGNSEIVDLLVERGANVQSLRTINVSFTKKCLSTPEPASELPIGMKYRLNHSQPIQAVVFSGQVRILEKLLDLGVPVDATYDAWFGCEPLETIESANPIHLTKGLTTLQAACARGKADMVELLLQRGANPNSRSVFFKTEVQPLGRAVMGKNARCISLLLAAGAVVDDEAPSSMSALFFAVIGNNAEAVNILLSQGAQADRRVDDKDPLFYAKDPSIAASLVQHGASLHQEFHGTTPLQAAATHQDRTSVLIKLIELGAPVNQKTDLGHTALSAAVDWHQKENALILLRNGANPKLLKHDTKKKLEKLVGDLSQYSNVRSDKEVPSNEIEKPQGFFQRLVARPKPGPSTTNTPAGTAASLRDDHDVHDDDEKTLHDEGTVNVPVLPKIKG